MVGVLTEKTIVVVTAIVTALRFAPWVKSGLNSGFAKAFRQGLAKPDDPSP
jgi:hypothetical protein